MKTDKSVAIKPQPQPTPPPPPPPIEPQAYKLSSTDIVIHDNKG